MEAQSSLRVALQISTKYELKSEVFHPFFEVILVVVYSSL